MTSTSRPWHPRRWPGWPQWLTHQVGWWACVLWMGWQGPLVMAGFVLLHVMILGAASKPDLLMMLAATLVGLVLDNALGALGLVTYVGSVTMGYAPLWLVMIWAGFGVTLRHSQSIFIRSRSHALLLGALCGPLAYWGGVKLERMTIGGTNAWIAIAVFWAVALTALHEVPKRWAAAS